MPIFFGVITVLLLTANSWHVIAQWATNKPNEMFMGIAHYWADYFLYISQMVQGAQGSWIWAHHQFTNESLQPTWIYWFNVLLGKWIALGIPSYAVYNTAIVLFGFFLLLLVWIIIMRLFPNKPIHQMIAFLMTATASNFPDVIYLPNRLLGDFWFSPTPALNRLGGVPHQIFQTILLMSVILLFSSLSLSARKISRLFTMNYLLLAICSFLAATANPIQMVIVCMAIIGASLYKRLPLSAQTLCMLISVLLPALAGALLTNAEFARQPILTAAKSWEDAQHASTNMLQFWFALGPIGLLLPFGVVPFMKNLSPIRRMIAIYGLLSLGIFVSPIPQLLGTTAARWISPASYMLFPIVAAEGLIYLSNLLRRWTRTSLSVTSWCTSILVLYLVLTVPAITVQVQGRAVPLATDPMLRTLNHIPNTYIQALLSIQNSHRDGVVLTDPTIPIDVLVPVFTKHQTFTGHPIHTLYPAAKEALRQKFFAGDMNQSERNQFFIDHRITFIISASNRQQWLAGLPELTELMSNTSIRVFTVNK